MPELEPAQNPETSESDSKLSRREFARRAAFAATTAVVAPASLLSQESCTQANVLRPARRLSLTAQLSPALQGGRRVEVSVDHPELW